MDVIDLHCDLLAYLAMSSYRTPNDPVVRCSLPQLKQGSVKTQVLALGSETVVYSIPFGLRQLEVFLELEKNHPEQHLLPAFENASTFALEIEPLDDVFKRLEFYYSKITPLYIGITWNGENRFGGGCGSKAGLKPDGVELLKFLSGRGTAIDFAHTSDPLAHDLLDTIDKHSLKLPVMASHSNFRAKRSHIRNLPDEIARELIHRKGLIGLVFYNKFLGDLTDLLPMIEYGLSLGAEDSLAFGADYFCTEDLVGTIIPGGGFAPELSDASKYPSILDSLDLPADQLEKIAHKNARAFFTRIRT